MRYLVFLWLVTGSFFLQGSSTTEEACPWGRLITQPYSLSLPNEFGASLGEPLPFMGFSLGKPVDEPSSHEAIEEYNNSLEELMSLPHFAQYVFHVRQGHCYKRLSLGLNNDLGILFCQGLLAASAFHALLMFAPWESSTLAWIQLTMTGYCFGKLYLILLKSTLVNYRYFQSKRFTYYNQEFQNRDKFIRAVRRMEKATQWVYDSLPLERDFVVNRLRLQSFWKDAVHCKNQRDFVRYLETFQRL